MIGVTILYGLGLAYVVYWGRGVIRERRAASAGAASPTPLTIAAEPTSASLSWSAIDDRQLARYLDGLPPLR